MNRVSSFVRTEGDKRPPRLLSSRAVDWHPGREQSCPADGSFSRSLLSDDGICPAAEWDELHTLLEKCVLSFKIID